MIYLGNLIWKFNVADVSPCCRYPKKKVDNLLRSINCCQNSVHIILKDWIWYFKSLERILNREIVNADVWLYTLSDFEVLRFECGEIGPSYFPAYFTS